VTNYITNDRTLNRFVNQHKWNQ